MLRLCDVFDCERDATHRITYIRADKVTCHAHTCEKHLNEFLNHLVACQYSYTLERMSGKEVVIFT